MRPFLFLGTRAEAAVADSEYDAVLRFSGLAERDVRRVRLERDPLGDVVLDDWSGIVLGGGPFNVTDPQHLKSAAQLRAERELRELALRVVTDDFPFLGACYGIGTLGSLAGGLVDRTYAEPIGAVSIALTSAGRDDALFGVLPDTFDAFVGHKEAVSRLPHGAVLLASSAACPVQGFRLGHHVYATQFHPELDVDALVQRIDVYRHHGYFDPVEVEEVQRRARTGVVTDPPRLLARFVERYAR
jgi:GMP synthase (glutamine-hydrolysing)